MPLSGYKFAGRYCQKGSLTDQQWAKRMHETKVAAFMAANELANAGWECDMEGSPDGNIHCLDTVGNNYCTCFKNTSLGVYFCILTLTAFKTRVDETGYVATARFYRSNRSTSPLGRFASNCSAFCRIGAHSFDYNNAANEFYMAQTLMFPVGNPGPTNSGWNDSSSSQVAYNNAQNTLFSLAENYYGFAIKGADVIAFAGKDISNVAVSLFSADAYSSVFSPDDSFISDGLSNKGILLINFQAPNSNYMEINSQYSENSSGVVVSPNLNNNFDVDSYSYLCVPPVAVYYGNVTNYPFQSAYVTCFKQNPSSLIYGRGIVKIDLLACNYEPSGQQPTRLSTVANGSYLTVKRDSSGLSAGEPQLGFNTATSGSNLGNVENFNAPYPLTYYVGWDPSNPDITQASAWTLYTGE